CGDHVRS
ncbi:voltage gated chloride channel family protein, partial [Vibrio parahaemolyticus 861]